MLRFTAGVLSFGLPDFINLIGPRRLSFSRSLRKAADYSDRFLDGVDPSFGAIFGEFAETVPLRA